MAKTFYRRKEAGKPDSFYEQGTNRYIGSTEFGTGAGWQEVQNPVSPGSSSPPAPGGPSDTGEKPEFDYLKEYEERVAKPSRKRFEDYMLYQRGLRPRDEILTGARTEVGLPDVTAAKERTQGTIDQLNNYLDKLQADLQVGLGQIERTSQPQVLAGRQGAFLERNIAAEKAPISLGLGSASRALSGLTEREQYLQDLANQLTDARVYQAEQPLREFEARSAFEGQQDRDLFELLKTQASRTDKLPTSDIQQYEYYVKQEKAAGREPLSYFEFSNYKAPKGGGNTNDTTPEDEFTDEQLRDLRAAGALGYGLEFQDFLINTLTPTQRTKFLDDWRAEQNKRGVSTDPGQFYEYWRTHPDEFKYSTSSSKSTEIPRHKF